MGAPSLAVDWNGIRAAAIAIGNVSEAARSAAEHLPPEERERFREAVSKRASREQWLSKAAQAVSKAQTAPTLATVGAQNALSKRVQSGAEAVQNTLADRQKQTKLSLSKWTARASKQLASLKGEEALAAHQPAVSVASVMTKIWPEQAAPSVRISMFAPGQVVDIEATVVEPSCGTDVEQA